MKSARPGLRNAKGRLNVKHGGQWLRIAVIGGVIVFWGAGCRLRASPNSTLCEAAEQGDLPGVRWHLKNGAPVDETSQDGWTPLMLSAYQGNVRLIRLLVNSGADVNARNAAGANPLMIAIHSGQWEAVRFLLDNGSDANARTTTGRTPLMIAVRRGDPRMVEALLRKGADTNAVDNHGATAFLEVARLERQTGFKQTEIAACLAGWGGSAAPAGGHGE